jgi:asparagine synthetase B (glutamine-hydrolysing)
VGSFGSGVACPSSAIVETELFFADLKDLFLSPPTTLFLHPRYRHQRANLQNNPAWSHTSLDFAIFTMCGIYASISGQGFRVPKDGLKKLLCNRGPDCNDEEQIEVGGCNNSEPCYVSLMSTVLAMREDLEAAAQPFVDSASGCSLCWNGEAWKIGPSAVAGNDGRLIFEKLLLASQSPIQCVENPVLQVLRSISGPFAFVYLDKVQNTMYFGRDRLGRRSMLFKFDAEVALLELSSVADSTCDRWQEVEADGIYQLDLNEPSFLENPLKERLSLHDIFVGSIYNHSWHDGSRSVSPIFSFADNMLLY